MPAVSVIVSSVWLQEYSLFFRKFQKIRKKKWQENEDIEDVENHNAALSTAIIFQTNDLCRLSF